MDTSEGEIIENNDEYYDYQDSSFLKKQQQKIQINKKEIEINTDIKNDNLNEQYKEIHNQNYAIKTCNENDLEFNNNNFFYNSEYNNNLYFTEENEKKKEVERRRKEIEELERQIKSQKTEDISDEDEEEENEEKYENVLNEVPWDEVGDEGENMENLKKEDKIANENKNEIIVSKDLYFNTNNKNQSYHEIEEKEISRELKKNNENDEIEVEEEEVICVDVENKDILGIKDNYIKQKLTYQTNQKVESEINGYENRLKLNTYQGYEKDEVNSNKFKIEQKSIAFTENSNIIASPKANNENNNKEDIKEEKKLESNLNSNYNINNGYNQNNVTNYNYMSLNSNINSDENIEVNPIKQYNYDINNCYSNQNKMNYGNYNEINFSIYNSNGDNTNNKNIIYNNNNNITDDRIDENNISRNNPNSNYDMNFYESSKRDNENENLLQKNKLLGFNDLLNNKMFKKFLKNKLKEDNNNIPQYFINNIDIIEEQKINQNQNRNVFSKTIDDNDEDRRNKASRNKSSGKLHKNYSSYFNQPETNIYSIYNYKKNDNYNRFSENLNNNLYNTHKNFYSKDKIRNTDYEYQKERNNLLIENKKLMNKIVSLQNEIQTSKAQLYDREYELKNYFDIHDKMANENKINIEKIENLKKELFAQRNEMQNQMNKIIELENVNKKLKIDLNKLQENFDFETSNNIETKQNYDTIKSNYNDIRNQYDLLHIKYQTLSDENFNFRRDKDLYEKQIKSKNEMIENLLENKSVLKKYHNENIFSKNNNRYLLDFIKEDEKSLNINNIVSNGMDNEDNLDKQRNEKKKNKFAKLTYPELQSKRDELIREKKEITNVYCKIPPKTTNKQQINKRINLEKKLDEIKNDLAEIKLRLKYYSG